MKKLMVALAAVAMAAGVQAATVNWGGATANSAFDAGIAAGSTAYLIFSSAAFSPAAATSINPTAGTTDNGGTVVSTYTTTAADTANWGFGSTYASDDLSKINGYYGVMMIDAAGDANKASWMYVGQISGATATSSGFTVQFNDDWATNDYLSMNGYNATVAVPEPTSGLLLILGMAGLALRRRRA